MIRPCRASSLGVVELNMIPETTRLIRLSTAIKYIELFSAHKRENTIIVGGRLNVSMSRLTLARLNKFTSSPLRLVSKPRNSYDFPKVFGDARVHLIRGVSRDIVGRPLVSRLRESIAEKHGGVAR